MGVLLTDESDPKQPQHDPLLTTNSMRPLDVGNLAVSWPIWRQQFKIYLLAIHDQVSERRKLAIFLNCLGPGGISLATKFVPELKEFDSVAISFEQLWSLFDDLSAKSKPKNNSFVDTFYFYEMIKNWQFDGNLYNAHRVLESAAEQCDFRVCDTRFTERMVRDQLMRIIPEHEHIVIRDLLKLPNPDSQAILSKYNEIQKERQIWAPILPYLSLCDMEALSLSIPALKDIVQWFIGTLGPVQIKQCCLDSYCPETSSGFYEKYGAIVRNLKLSNISESDIRKIIGFFQGVENFALKDVQILESDSWDEFPTDLVAVSLTNTTMELNLMMNWLSGSFDSLDTMELENFDYSFYASSFTHRVQPLYLGYFTNLRALTIKADVVNVIVSESEGPCNLEFLKLIARSSLSPHFNCPKLRHLHYNVEEDPSILWIRFKAATYSLTSLITKWSNSERLLEFEALDWLKITTPVPLALKPDIESLNIKTKIVEYEPLPIIPEEPNLIFDLLNEYCILEIMDYLSVPDWMTFAQLNATAERAAVSYKYPRQNLKSEHCIKANMLLNLEHFEYVCGSVKTFSLGYEYVEELRPYFRFLRLMPELKSLSVSLHFSYAEMVDDLPDGLERLELSEQLEVNVDVAPYFKRLAPTLKFLKLRYYGNNEHCLAHLENLRELDILAVNLSVPSLTNLLERNSETLEYLKLFLNGISESGWVLYEEVLQAIGSMRNLKVLKIRRNFALNGVSDGLDGGCHLVADMFKKIGHQLETVAIDIYSEEMLEALNCEELANITEMNIDISAHVSREIGLAILSSRKSLRKASLRIGLRYRQNLDLEIPELMSLLEALPHLTHLRPGGYKTTIKFRKDLKEYLRQKNRELWINNVKV